MKALVRDGVEAILTEVDVSGAPRFRMRDTCKKRRQAPYSFQRGNAALEIGAPLSFGRSADCQSATRQVANLRY